MTQGEIAYREDCARRGVYPDGQTRRDWSQLDDLVRSTWERNPTARDYEEEDVSEALGAGYRYRDYAGQGEG
jgi:hypothetical protein